MSKLLLYKSSDLMSFLSDIVLVALGAFLLDKAYQVMIKEIFIVATDIAERIL